MKNGIIGCVSFIFQAASDEFNCSYYTLKIFGIFHKYKFTSRWHKADFPLMKHFKYIYLLIKEGKKKKLLFSFNYHQGMLSNSFSQIVSVLLP